MSAVKRCTIVYCAERLRMLYSRSRKVCGPFGRHDMSCIVVSYLALVLNRDPSFYKQVTRWMNFELAMVVHGNQTHCGQFVFGQSYRSVRFGFGQAKIRVVRSVRFVLTKNKVRVRLVPFGFGSIPISSNIKAFLLSNYWHKGLSSAHLL